MRIQSGTGSFSAINRKDKSIRVKPGAPLVGTVELTTVNHGAIFAIAPLIYTPSWGSHEESWGLVMGWVALGTSAYTAHLELNAPNVPGSYAILFAFTLERTGDEVASSTNWAAGNDVWYDGNDLAEFTPEQIADAQRYGCAVNDWLLQGRYAYILEPSDAITVGVKD